MRFDLKFLGSQLSYLLEKHQTRRNLRALGKFLALLAVVVVAFAVIFHLLMIYEGKQHSWATGFYWTLTVMSTLGFGDITFESDLGRMFSMVVLLTGIVLLLIVLPFAFIRFFYAPWLEAQVRSQAPRIVPPNVSGHVLLCSWDGLTRGLADRLALLNIPYFVIEPDPVRATDLHVEGIPVVRGELDERATYESARIAEARAVLASLDDATNTSIILTAREACPSAQVLALAENEESIDLLEMAGASHVLPIKQRLGEQLANRVEASRCSAHVIGRFETLLIAEFPVYRTPLAGRTLLEAQLRQITGVNVVGVWERGRLRQAGPTTVLEDWTIPVVVGTDEQIKALDDLIHTDVVNGHPVIVVGGGKVGRATAAALVRKGVPVHLIEHDTAVASKADPSLCKIFVGEGADRDLLMRAGIEKAPSVVLTTNDDATNIYLSIYYRKLNPDLIIVARITHERNIESIHRAGADFVLSYSSLGQESVVAVIQKRDFVFLGGDVDFYMLPVPALLAGTTLRTSGIGARTGLNIIGVRQGDSLRNPGPETRLVDGATLLAIGTPKQRSEFKKVFG
jgi:Trk K+ transport system NAD-binding subunit